MASEYAKDIESIKEDVAEIKALFGRLEAGTLCPYREKIQQASNNHTRLHEVEQQVQDNRVGIAKLVVSGSIGGAIVAAAQMLLAH